MTSAKLRLERATLSPQASDESLWTIKDVATYLQLKTKTVYKLIGRQEIPCIHLGRNLRFDRFDVIQWAAERKE